MTPPWRIPTVLDRSETGPICLERDFDIRLLYPKVREMVKKHSISFDPENVIPADDSMADELWKAGLELYLDVGTLCTTTHRRMLFTEAEIREALSLFPEKLVVGEDKESREVYRRKIEDGRRPFSVFSPSLPFSEELFVPVEMAYAMEPLADGVGAPVLDELLGRKVRGGSPSDIGSGMAHAMMIREAVRRVGRPGIYLADVQSALSDAAQIAASNPNWGVRCRDGRMVGSIAELKMDYGGLNRMVNFHEGGYIVMALFGPMVGGYAGGAEGTAVVSVASHLQGLMVNQGHLDVFFPFHIVQFCNTTRELLWMTSLVYQALTRNSPFLSLSNGIGAAGPCTKMALLEAAAHGLTSTVSGAHLWEFFSARNRNKDRTTPMEARIACEVGYGIAKAKTTRQDANEILKGLLKRYEDNIKDAPLGKTFQECYDVKTITPSQEYTLLYKDTRRELTNLGVPLPY